jgi:hypothetical protein
MADTDKVVNAVIKAEDKELLELFKDLLKKGQSTGEMISPRMLQHLPFTLFHLLPDGAKLYYLQNRFSSWRIFYWSP